MVKFRFQDLKIWQLAIQLAQELFDIALYVIRVKKRDSLSQFLRERDIYTGFHYPVPLHLQDAYQQLGYQKGIFPNCEKASHEILSLPMYPELSKEQINYIRTKIAEYFK